MRREFSITGLLKPEFIDLPTDRIRAPHISFDSFCRKVEKASSIKFDAARDELGWVQEPLGPGGKQEYLAISSERLFQNALGVMRLTTSQSEPPQALILHLWSPAPKEPIFRRSHRAPVPKESSVGDGLESEANSQQPSGSTTPPVINPALNRSGGADADVEMTTLTTSVATQPKHSGSVQESTTDREPRPQILVSTNNCEKSPADLGLSQQSGSESDTVQRNSKAKDQELEDLNSTSVTPAASTEYPHTNEQIPLNMGMLLNALNRDDIRGGDKQPDETEEQYQIRVAEENEMLAELENQKLVTLCLVLFLSILTII
jgi:hypothetical protein